MPGSPGPRGGVPQGGKQAAYMVRWVSKTGEPGPWGETITATVAA